MTSDPNRDNSRKEKKMDATTRATSVAVLVTLGLTLAAQAAEPAATPNAGTRSAKPDWSKFNWVKLGALAGVEIAMCLFGRADKEMKYVDMGEEYLRRVEARFIHWNEGGRVSEQTGYMPRIGFTGGGVAQAFGKAFEATGNPICLAKALTLARPLIEEFAAQQGKYAWDHYSAPRAAINLLEMYQFLKKHNLPGGE